MLPEKTKKMLWTEYELGKTYLYFILDDEISQADRNLMLTQ